MMARPFPVIEPSPRGHRAFTRAPYTRRPMGAMPRGQRAVAGAAAVVIIAAVILGAAPGANASAAIIGSGSSFAGIEFQEWTKDVGAPPYNLNVNYQLSSSGQGRENFTDGVVDFAVTDIRYNKYDTKAPPAGTFEYIPVTAGGIAFMYNLQKYGFTDQTTPINLSSLTVCGIFTTAIQYWDDPAIKADNPGVNLPHVLVYPVVRNDPAGTNFVMQEYCIQLHNDLYAQFARAASLSNGTDYPDEPTSTWPIVSPINGVTGSESAADTVSQPNGTGTITAVETGYAIQRHFPVAAVRNDTGAYVTPTTLAVSTALSYATQQPDGTHNLNFNPGDPAAYNPSTYSYMLVHTSNGDPAKGPALTTFAEYDLTFGQAGADKIGYASIGRALILFGLDRLKNVPGYVAPTDAMLAKIPGQEAVPSHATAASATTGASSAATASTASGPSAVTNAATSGSRTAGNTGQSVVQGATTSRAAARTSSGAARSGSRAVTGVAASAPVDPAASLGPATGPLGRTGLQTNIAVSIGLALLVVGEVTRRRARRKPVT